MILYNVTINIEQSVEIQWLEWMRNKHINDVLNTGCFVSARLSRLTSHTDPNSTNYAVLYFCESAAKLEEYKAIHAPALMNEGIQKFGSKLQAFRTEMDVLENFFPNQN